MKSIGNRMVRKNNSAKYDIHKNLIKIIKILKTELKWNTEEIKYVG